MKKIYLIFILGMMITMFSSCRSINSYIKNVTIQTLDEIQEKILLYRNRLSTMINRPTVSNLSKKLPLATVIRPGSTLYSREELPPEYDYVYNPNVVDPEFVMKSSDVLDQYMEIIDLTDDFKEDSFASVPYEDYAVKYKVINEENQVYIEAYKYDSWNEEGTKNSFVDAEIIYMNLIENKMHFQMVRDVNENYGDHKTHRRYYEMLVESGDTMSMVVDMNETSFVSYQKHNKSDNSSFLFSNSEEGQGYQYTDVLTDTTYTIFFSELGISLQSFVIYGTYNPVLTFAFYPYDTNLNVTLKWNLLHVDGWDHVLVNQYDADSIFIGENELLKDFTTEVFVDIDTEASTYVVIPESSLTENFLNLTDHGLLFDDITLDQLLNDKLFLIENYQSLLISHGFSEDMSVNNQIIRDIFPFFGDEKIIRNLL